MADNNVKCKQCPSFNGLEGPDYELPKKSIEELKAEYEELCLKIEALANSHIRDCFSVKTEAEALMVMCDQLEFHLLGFGETLYVSRFYKALEEIFPPICPPPGVGFVAYKVLIAAIDVPDDMEEIHSTRKFVPAIAELWIPCDAKRSNALGPKCRASKVVVREIRATYDGKTQTVESGASPFRVFHGIRYFTGEEYEVENFDKNRWHECAPGIHFFMDREEAEQLADYLKKVPSHV